jgi:hypothetical protein
VWIGDRALLPKEDAADRDADPLAGAALLLAPCARWRRAGAAANAALQQLRFRSRPRSPPQSRLCPR